MRLIPFFLFAAALAGCSLFIPAMDLEGFRCESDDGCVAQEGYQCAPDGVCRVACDRDDECGGESCFQGFCRRDPPDPDPDDAGPVPDGGEVDGGVCCPLDAGDAGEILDDAGFDAGFVPDAGPDAGLDAGPAPDAGPVPDAGSDAGPCDGPDPRLWFPDRDDDGFGDRDAVGIPSCEEIFGHVTDNTDCDDDEVTGASVYPGAEEVVADGVDQDCDGVDACYRNDDGDPFGVDEVVLDSNLDCDDMSDLTSSVIGDCNDDDPDVYPDAPDVPYNGVDEDCLGDDDYDLDGDGYVRDQDVSLATYEGFAMAMPLPGTGNLPGGDCNDDEPLENPGGREILLNRDAEGYVESWIDQCEDGLDNECNGDTDGDDYLCQDDDGDGLLNGADPIQVLDQDEDTVPETLCVVAEYVMPDPWNGEDAVRNGDPPAIFGGFTTINAARVDPLSDIMPGAWCYDFSGHADDTCFIYRYVSMLAFDESGPPSETDCDTWKSMKITYSCDMNTPQEPFCRWVTGSDGCNSVVSAVGVCWNPTTGFEPNP